MILNAEQNKKLVDLAQEFNLQFIVLFGSQTTGQATSQSDYDIAIMTRDDKRLYGDLDYFTKILTRSSEVLGLPAERLDLTDLHNEDILLRYNIVLAGQLLFGDTDDYENFRLLAIREYQGAEALFELERDIIDRRQELLAKSLAKI